MKSFFCLSFSLYFKDYYTKYFNYCLDQIGRNGDVTVNQDMQPVFSPLSNGEDEFVLF